MDSPPVRGKAVQRAARTDNVHITRPPPRRGAAPLLGQGHVPRIDQKIADLLGASLE